MLAAQSLLITALAAMAAPHDHGTKGPFDIDIVSSTPAVEHVQATDKTETRPADAKAGADTAATKRADAPPVPVLSKRQRHAAEQCLALNIYHEARSESATGQKAVAAVTLNRVASHAFPSSVCKVVKQGGKRRNKCQFSWVCDDRSDKPRESGAWERALELSRKALSGQISDPTHGALYYHATRVKPRWARTFKRTNRIGHHIFYKPRGA